MCPNALSAGKKPDGIREREDGGRVLGGPRAREAGEQLSLSVSLSPAFQRLLRDL